MNSDTQLVYTRLPNEDNGGYLKFPACPISEYLALAIFDEHLEVHMMKPTDDPREFDLITATNPMFYVGTANIQTVMYDLTSLSVVEFARKYEHGEIRELSMQTEK